MIVVKNLPYDTTQDELVKLFHGAMGSSLPQIMLSPSRTIALVEYEHRNYARKVFQKLAYKRFKHVPLYLEWAPICKKKIPNDSKNDGDENDASTSNDDKPKETSLIDTMDEEEESASIESSSQHILYVKNLNFSTTEESLQKAFENVIGKVRAVKIPTKIAPVKKNKGSNDASNMTRLSMGYGFVEFHSAEDSRKALSKLQGSFVDGHKLELKVSSTNKLSQTSTANKANIKTGDAGKSKTKLIVRNVAFQSSRTELLQLFGSFGQLKNVRIPRKLDGGNRGFAFVDYVSSKEAQNAMAKMSQTHLYGRHLVLEWADDDEKETVDSLREKAKRDASFAGMGTPKNKKIRFD